MNENMYRCVQEELRNAVIQKNDFKSVIEWENNTWMEQAKYE